LISLLFLSSSSIEYHSDENPFSLFGLSVNQRFPRLVNTFGKTEQIYVII